ncbi:hypothetical protein M9H77_19284 [Catharanthus roseus]|uniref:Uncharacterized protein n=1 Tax=Catharanthus roseus TaxID=4058 RepID=A0ACC0B9W5_CATRO|nr:hypothetical protein M9H77_19284 [Catharanthus roseus]
MGQWYNDSRDNGTTVPIVGSIEWREERKKRRERVERRRWVEGWDDGMTKGQSHYSTGKEGGGMRDERLKERNRERGGLIKIIWEFKRAAIGGLDRRSDDESEYIFYCHLIFEIKNFRLLTVTCECGGAKKSRTKPRVDDEEVPIKRQGPYGTKKVENWQLFVHDRRYNYVIGVYHHDHAQAARLTEEQLIQTEQFRKSYATTLYVTIFLRTKCGLCCELCCITFTRYNMPLLKAVGMTPTALIFSSPVSIGNKEDINAYELVVIFTDRESGLISVIDKVFNRSYHMLCRMLIDHNVLAKLTEMIKDEEVVSRFINSTWHKLLNKIDEAEYYKRLDNLKMKWRKKIDFILIESKRVPEIIDDSKNKCNHYLRTSTDLPYSCKLITRGIYPSSQEKNMDAEMLDLAFCLDQISTGPIYKVREMHHLAKEVLSSVLPTDPDMSLTSIPKVIVTKGRHKTDSTKRDKSYWEHFSIAHRKIQKSGSSSKFGSRLNSGSGLGSRGRGRPPQALRDRGRECSSRRSSLSSPNSVIDPSIGSTFPFSKKHMHHRRNGVIEYFLPRSNKLTHYRSETADDDVEATDIDSSSSPSLLLSVMSTSSSFPQPQHPPRRSRGIRPRHAAQIGPCLLLILYH